jgi:hypothetical protein
LVEKKTVRRKKIKNIRCFITNSTSRFLLFVFFKFSNFLFHAHHSGFLIPHSSQRTAQHSTAQHSTAQHSTAQHSTAQHSTAQHCTAQHSTP